MIQIVFVAILLLVSAGPLCFSQEAKSEDGITLPAVFDRDRLEELPSPLNIWSLLQNQEPSTVTNHVDEGGFQTGLIGLAGAHGNSWSQNSYRLNGLNVTNPYEPGKPLVYPLFGSLEEFRVGAILQSAAERAPGSSFQLRNREGGRSLHTQAEAYYLGGPLQWSNLDDRLRRFGFSSVPQFRHFSETEFSAGGPVPHFSKWHFFSDLGFQRMTRTIPDFDQVPKTSVFSGLLRGDGTLGPQDQLSVVVDGQSIRMSHLGAQAFVAPSATLRGYDRFEVVQGHWTHLPGGSTAWDVSFGFSHSSPTDTLQWGAAQPNATNLFSGEMNGAAPIESDAALSRFSLLASGRTRHQSSRGWQNRLDYGIDWEESLATEERRVFQGARLLFYPLNTPSEIIEYNSPSHAMQRLRELSLFVEDSFRLSNRLLLRFGVNFDASTTWLPEQKSGEGAFTPARRFAGAGGIVAWKSIAPRIAAAVPLSSPIGNTRVFAGYSRYYHLLPTSYADYANPTSLSGQVFLWDDRNQDRLFQAGEEGTLIRRFGGLYSAVDPNLKRPYTDEFAIGIQQSLGRRLQLNVRLIQREERKLVKSINVGVPQSAYTPVNIEDAGDDSVQGTSDDRILTVYNQDPATLGKDRFLLTNADGEKSSYRGLESWIRASFAQKGFIDISFTAYESTGSGAPGNSEFENDPGAVEGLYSNPNALINARGRFYFDRAYVGKVAACFKAPMGLRFGTVISYVDGLPFGRKLIIPDFNQGPFFVMATPRGEPGGFRTQYNIVFDQRLAHDFSIGGHRLSFMADVFNLLNRNNNLQEYDISGPLFPLRKPMAVENPRVIRLGIRWNM